MGTAYFELVDPVKQRRLTEQSMMAAGGDPEAMELDNEFHRALESALRASRGLGKTIRDTVLFPTVRPG
jgi:lysyl-tRNA synthetase class 2